MSRLHESFQLDPVIKQCIISLGFPSNRETIIADQFLTLFIGTIDPSASRQTWDMILHPQHRVIAQ